MTRRTYRDYLRGVWDPKAIMSVMAPLLVIVLIAGFFSVGLGFTLSGVGWWPLAAGILLAAATALFGVPWANMVMDRYFEQDTPQ